MLRFLDDILYIIMPCSQIAQQIRAFDALN